MTEQLNNIERTIGRIEGTVSSILEEAKKTNGTIRSHEARLNDCESKLNQAIGAGKRTHLLWAGAVAVIGILIAILKK